jgi:hypothetical protein
LHIGYRQAEQPGQDRVHKGYQHGPTEAEANALPASAAAPRLRRLVGVLHALILSARATKNVHNLLRRDCIVGHFAQFTSDAWYNCEVRRRLENSVFTKPGKAL